MFAAPPPHTAPNAHAYTHTYTHTITPPPPKQQHAGEWAQQPLDAGPKTVSWGVTLVPPGYDEEAHPEIAEIVRSQNRR